MATEDRLPAEIIKGNTEVPFGELVSTSPLKHWRIAINDLRNFVTTLAPENHTSEDKIHGLGDITHYGHLRITDEVDVNLGVTEGTAITPKGIKDNCLLLHSDLNKTNVNTIDASLLFGDVNVSNIKTETLLVEDNPDSVLKSSCVINTKCIINNDIYVNSSKNSVILNNDGTNFNIKIATSLDSEPQTLIPLSFVLENTTSSYDKSVITGKMTIGGDLHTQGTITATGKVHNAIWNDYAEFFEKGEDTEVGDFIALDTSSDEEKYVKASQYNKNVMGVHSDSYGYILGGTNNIKESEKTHIPVGMVGRVNAKIVGAINKGDYIVLSEIPGVGKVYCPSTNTPLDVIGVAIEKSDEKDIKLVKIKIK